MSNALKDFWDSYRLKVSCGTVRAEGEKRTALPNAASGLQDLNPAGQSERCDLALRDGEAAFDSRKAKLTASTKAEVATGNGERLDTMARRALAADRVIANQEARRAEAEREAYIPDTVSGGVHTQGQLPSPSASVTSLSSDTGDRPLTGALGSGKAAPPAGHDLLAEHRAQMSDMVEYEPDYRDSEPSDVRAELERYK